MAMHASLQKFGFSLPRTPVVFCGRLAAWHTQPLLVSSKQLQAHLVQLSAAGNAGMDGPGPIDYYSPAAYPNVITVTAMGDFDGKPGGLGPKDTCALNMEDDVAGVAFSNYVVTTVSKKHTVAAPGETDTWAMLLPLPAYCCVCVMTAYSDL